MPLIYACVIHTERLAVAKRTELVYFSVLQISHITLLTANTGDAVCLMVVLCVCVTEGVILKSTPSNSPTTSYTVSSEAD